MVVEGLSIEQWLENNRIQQTYSYFKHKYGKQLSSDEIISIGNFVLTKTFNKFDKNFAVDASFDKYFYKAFSNELNTACTKRVKEFKLKKRFLDQQKVIKRKEISDFVPYPILSEKENSILYKKFWESKNLREIAAEFGVSFQYISVVLNRALDKLKKDLENEPLDGVF